MQGRGGEGMPRDKKSLIVSSLECFTVQNQVQCAEFDTKGLFSHSSAKCDVET